MLDAVLILESECDRGGRTVDFVFAFLNGVGERLLGLPRDRLVGTKLSETIPVLRGDGLFDEYVRVAESGTPFEREFANTAPEIRAEWLHQRAVAVPGGIAIAMRDIGERKHALRVSDTGIGIAAADLPRVLTPFVQVESTMTRQHAGTGLGLPIVKSLAEMHDGELSIESAPGHGTTVSVRFGPSRVLVAATPAASRPGRPRRAKPRLPRERRDRLVRRAPGGPALMQIKAAARRSR